MEFEMSIKEFLFGPKVSSSEDEKGLLTIREFSGKKLHKIVRYHHGKLNGICETYFKNGLISERIAYKDDKKHGMRESYFSNGNLWLEENYENDKLEGIARIYTEKTGKLLEQIEYKNGKRNGLSIRYDEKGNIVSSVLYKDGAVFDEVQVQKEQMLKEKAKKEQEEKRNVELALKNETPRLPVVNVGKYSLTFKAMDMNVFVNGKQRS